MEKLIDIRSYPVAHVLENLLADKSTKRNIIWATDSYAAYGEGFSDKMENGMIVMGISQGGILGRYGAYLYDKQRNSKTDAPIRLYASLDSPHQGAVLPRSLYPTIDFWATSGGSSAAEAFKDLINGPGASGLLIYERKQKCTLPTFCDDIYRENFGNDRFLFNEYRILL